MNHLSLQNDFSALKEKPKAYLILGIGFLFLIALGTFRSQDPALFNLMMPKNGIQNFLGLPGALIAGSLHQIFGWSSLQIPFFILFTKYKAPLPIQRSLLRIILSFLAINIMIALIIPGQGKVSVEWAGFFGNIADQTFNSWYWIVSVLIFLLAFLIKTFKMLEINSFIFLFVATLLSTLLTIITRAATVINLGLGKVTLLLKKLILPKVVPYFKSLRETSKKITGFFSLVRESDLSLEHITNKTNSRLNQTSDIKGFEYCKNLDYGEVADMNQHGFTIKKDLLLRKLLKAYEKKYFHQN